MEINVESDIILNMDTAVPCGLIINELVTNSIKHGFVRRNSGQIYINLQSNDGCLTLIVGDYGIGLPEEVDIENPQKLGLQLVKSLIDQLEGKIEFNGNTGTEFIFKFRELIYKDRMKKL